MRVALWLLLLSLNLSIPATAEIIYARPDATDGNYFWEQDLVAESMPFREAIEKAKKVAGAQPLEIRLLRREGAQETIYAIDLGSKQSALRWHGSAANRLMIRGQIDRSQRLPRPFTTVTGWSLRDTLCQPESVDLCDPTPRGRSPAPRQDAIDELAVELERPNNVRSERPAAHDVRFRIHCMLLWESAFVEFVSLGFRDCWLLAVGAYASSNIALRDSVIIGSTYAFVTVGKKGAPETAHSYEITGNYWRQTSPPDSFRKTNCDIRANWNCPVSVWSDVPWAIVHHYFWSPLNGALFGAKDILGNVKIAGNYVADAYNGVRSKASDACLSDPRCRQRVNIGFEIVGNIFERIRDNPIEPEGRAAYWIIKHNTFVNVYAAISTDGVSGHDLLVFANIFALEEAPGAMCRDAGWTGSRQFQLTRGGGSWSADAAEGDDALCGTHRMGTIFKLGSVDDQLTDSPLLDRILFFNNSLRTRSPLFRGTPSPPIVSYNNAVRFIGCGRSGADACRQEVATTAHCTDVWTSDGQNLYAVCFQIENGGRPIAHVMAFNAYNRVPGPDVHAIDTHRVGAAVEFGQLIGFDSLDSEDVEKLFALPAGSPLASAGCTLAYGDGDLRCTVGGGLVGAMLPGGGRFDIDLPFQFPFDAALRLADALKALSTQAVEEDGRR